MPHPHFSPSWPRRQREEDAEGLATAAHSLRPQVSYMGAHELFDLLTRIEQCARQQGVAACKEHLSRLSELSDQVMTELHTALEEGWTQA